MISALQKTFSILLICSGGALCAQVLPTTKECKDSHKIIDGMEVMMVTEEMAVYKGGQQEMMRTYMRGINYPKNFRVSAQHTKVFVEFVIDTLGQVRNPCIINRTSTEGLNDLEKEVLRITYTLKDWTPAKHKGKKIPVLMSLPIQFEVKE
jgi:outer membrane biosynthesis protein TonB